MNVVKAHKQAVKAATAILVVHDQASPDLAALGISEAIGSLKLQAGDMDSLSALHRYAAGVEAREEKVSNRRWPHYHVGPLARQIAERARVELDNILA